MGRGVKEGWQASPEWIARTKSVLTTLALISESDWQALREACRNYHAKHTTGVGGAAICACGMGGGGSLACRPLKMLDELRGEAQDLQFISPSFKEKRQPAPKRVSGHYVVKLDNGVTIVKAKSIAIARKWAYSYFGSSKSPQTLYATEKDLDWVRSMGGTIHEP